MSDAPAAGNRILGSLRRADGSGVVTIQDRFATGLDDLWAALTDPERLVRWLGTVEGDLRPGGEFRATFFASGWEGTGRIDACEPPHRLLVTTWAPDEPNEQTIEATLRDDDSGTILVVEERGMPEELVAGYGAGVQIHVEDLAAILAGRERCDAAKRFDELHSGYEALAAELSL